MTEDTPQQECPPPRTSEAVDCWLRKWGRDAAVDGTEPLTRQDVERLIEANGGTAAGLVLFGRNMRGIDLEGGSLQGADLLRADLHAANLIKANLQGAHLSWANLQGANLSEAKLQGADLERANLQDAVLFAAKLQGANLFAANLQGARIAGIHLSRETNMDDVAWPGEYVLRFEEEGYFGSSVQSTYRALKTWHQEHGFYDIAGEFHHREMVCRRKATFPKLFGFMARKSILLRWLIAVLPSVLMALTPIIGLVALLARPNESWLARFWNLTRLNFYEQLFGYGERPWRVVRAAVAVVLGLALAYRYFGTFAQPVGVIDALYFSAVSFSALGYGSWAPEPQGWARYMGVAESFLGVFTIALFLVTFTRKMVR